MTFDNALDQLEPRTIWSSEMRDLLEQLRETYAPTVEMTHSQYNEFMNFKQKFGSSHLAAAINQGNNGTWSFLDELSGRIFEHGIGEMTDEYIEIIMQAWLHPETIKIVDE